MSDYLLDANILVYLANPASPFHPTTTQAVLKLTANGHTLRTCPQCFVEFRVVATRPAGAPNGLGLTSLAVAQDTTKFLSVFPILDDTAAIFPFWRNLVEGHGIIGKPNHDARLLATAAVHGCSAILTFNARDFTRYITAVPSVVIVDPTGV